VGKFGGCGLRLEIRGKRDIIETPPRLAMEAKRRNSAMLLVLVGEFDGFEFVGTHELSFQVKLLTDLSDPRAHVDHMILLPGFVKPEFISQAWERACRDRDLHILGGNDDPLRGRFVWIVLQVVLFSYLRGVWEKQNRLVVRLLE
jgi:hypothetical protein